MPKYAAIGFCVFARRRLFFSASMPFIPQNRPVSTTPVRPFRAAPSSDTSHSFIGPTPSAGGLFLCLNGLKGASMSQLPLSVTHSPALEGRPSRMPGARAPRAWRSAIMSVAKKGSTSMGMPEVHFVQSRSESLR